MKSNKKMKQRKSGGKRGEKIGRERDETFFWCNGSQTEIDRPKFGNIFFDIIYIEACFKLDYYAPLLSLS